MLPHGAPTERRGEWQRQVEASSAEAFETVKKKIMEEVDGEGEE